MPSRARSYGAWPGTTWSKAMAMSAPRAHWISIARSGVSLRVVPSTWLWKVDAVLLDPAETLEREDLEPARVGEHRSVPGGEAVETAHGSHHVLTRAEVQVIGVAEDDLRAGAADVGGTEAADDAMGAHRHEGGRADGAVRKREGSRASGAEGALEA